MYLNYHKEWYIALFIFIFSGCATYYSKNLQFQEQFANGDIEQANKTLLASENKVKKKDILLHYLQKGVVMQMLGDYNSSNQFFEQAYMYVEDYTKSFGAEFASLITNPTVKPYKAEDHEAVLIHYYMAMNYIMLGNLQEALVECQRINNRLNVLYDTYQYKNYRYKIDAFAHNLMGILYEATGNDNDAFIAYRNSYNAYKEIYSKNFNVNVPDQLKKDLIHTAYLNGFRDELQQYEKESGIKYSSNSNKNNGDLVFFWQNGLGPVKDEWSINFAVVKGQGGIMMFENEEMGISFPFATSNSDESSNLSKLKIIRVAFPKYIEREPLFTGAYLTINSKKYDLELAENINNISFANLEDRMLREMGNSLLRLALKQITEEQIRKQDEGLGMLASLVNAVTEKADTRNWQTLPYAISYARVSLPEGKYKVILNTKQSGQINQTSSFNVVINKGKTSFLMYHNLESNPPHLY